MSRPRRHRPSPGNDRQAITTLIVLTVSLLMWALWRVAPYRNVEPAAPAEESGDGGSVRFAPDTENPDP